MIFLNLDLDFVLSLVLDNEEGCVDGNPELDDNPECTIEFELDRNLDLDFDLDRERSLTCERDDE